MTEHIYDYASAQSVSREEFLEKALRFDSSNGTLTPDDDLRKIEELLLLKDGILTGEFWVNKQSCPTCGRHPTFYDIIKTAVDANQHNVSLMAHTLVGRKYILNHPRKAKCGNCATPLVLSCEYDGGGAYGCCWQPT